MDKKKQSKSPRQGGRLSAAEQQAQLAIAQQLGIPPEYLDPSLMGYGGLPSGIDPQQLLNPMAAAASGFPFMNPAALQAFAGLGSLGGQSTAGAAEWWNLAQNQALAASLGGFYPGMMPGFSMLSSDSLQNTKSSTVDKMKEDNRKSNSRNELSPRPGSSGASISRSQQDRKKSNESMNSSSRERPDSHHSTSSPFRGTNAKQSSSAGNSSWMDGVSGQHQQKLNEQVFQAEIMRQLEQQFLVQQLQLQQQQQQDQLTAALQSVMAGSSGTSLGSSSSSHKKGASSDAEKLQQQMAMMMQLMQTGATGSSLQGMSPAMASSLFSTPGALETMMAMSQMGNMNALTGLGNLQSSSKSNERTDHRDKNSLSSFSSHHRSSLHSPPKSKQYASSSSPSSSKTRVQSSSPRKSQRQTPESASTKNTAIPGISGIPGAELSPDNALLAALYSQQLQQQQYEAFFKQELDASNKFRNKAATPSSTSSRDSKSRSRVKQEPRHDSRNEFFSSSSHARSSLYSPANSTSSRGKAHTSPQRDFSKSPFRKSRDPDHSQSRGSSSSKHLSPSTTKHSSSKDHRQENVSETLKLFSALASNPNLTQQELAALLSIPNTADATALLSGMGAMQFPGSNAFLDPSQAGNQMTQSELEKLNKDLAAALAFETQRLQEQMRQQQLQLENNHKKSKDKDNRISVIHQNNTSSENTSDKASSSKYQEKAEKQSTENNKVNELKRRNEDAASSDGDVASEKNGSVGSNRISRKRRRVISGSEEVLEPLKHDWKREVRFRAVGNHLKGEVVYISPSGKKFRTYPDILKHIEENNMTHLQRNNFSFSSRLKVGSFLEQKEKEKGNTEWKKITEEELEQKIQQVDRSRNSSPLPDNCDQMSDYSSSSKADSKSSKAEKERADKERQREQLKLLQEQEKLQKLEQDRIEREVKERLAMEERRAAEAYEREQRRQQMLLIRALESRKKAEEREKRREEIRLERIREREKKMEQRRIAMQIARELKMPVEDMATIGAPELPHLNRLQGTYDNKCPHQLSGNASADLLMVLEFVKTFNECLRIDESTIPTFEQIQLGLLNDPNHTSSVVQITMSLLHQCLCDPGVPAPGPWLHCLTGVKVTDIDVSVHNYSEILRLFIWARSGFKTEIAQRLETVPFLSLTTDEKAQCLAFLVNELVCSRPICMEIEKNIDNLSTLRRDKWIVEGQMRQLRVARERNLMLEGPIIKLENPDHTISSLTPTKVETPKNSWEAKFQEKMDELTQLHSSYSTQLTNSSKPLRALDLGQDRYKRRYWVLPNLGGVYVEGLESGISYEDDDESPDEDEDEEEEEENLESADDKEESSDAPESESIKEEEEDGEDEEAEAIEDEEETMDEEDECKVDTENSYLDDQSGTMKISQSVLLQESNGIDHDNAVVSDAFTAEDANRIKKASSSQHSNNDLPVEDGDSMAARDGMEESAPPFHVPISNNSDSELPAEEKDANHTKSTDELANLATGKIENDLVNSDKDSKNSSVQNGDSSANSGDAYEDNDPVGDFDLCDNIDNDTRASSGISRSCTPEPDSNTNSFLYNPQSESNMDDDTSREYTNSPVLFTKPLKQSTAFTSPMSEKESSIELIPQPGLMKESLPTKEISTPDRENDEVLVAAKAIAAKAVASSSHLLFPEKESPTKSKTIENDIISEKTDNKSNIPNSEDGQLPLGEHTLNALVEMGVNPVSLNSQQLEALSHLDVPVGSTLEKSNNAEKNEMTKDVEESDKSNDVENNDSTDPLPSEPNKNVSKQENTKKDPENGRKKSDDQDIPMDLSCQTANSENQPAPDAEPFPVPKTLLAAADFPIKLEHRPITAQSDSPFRDSPDSKYGESKYFVPINFSNDMKMEQENYNSMISSRSSPNTLANYIVSTNSYSDFQSLDDIKFPIRAPDVKEEPDVIPREYKRGWWRIESMSQLRRLSENLHLRGIREKQLHRNITKNFEVCTNSMEDSTIPEHKFAVITVEKPKNEPEEKLTEVNKIKKTTRSSSQERKTENNDIASKFLMSEKLAFESEMKVLNQVEELATRCVDMAVVSTQWSTDNPQPSRHSKDLAHVPLPSLRDETGLEIKFDAVNPIQHDEASALGSAVNYLGSLERAVCRRYLKPPLVRKGGASEFSSLPSLSDGAMDVAHGLRIWRNAVASSSSAAQLSLCIRMLESCIAWDRSASHSPVKTEVLPSNKTKKRKGDKRGGASRTINRSESPVPPKKKRKRKTNTAKNAASSAEAGSKKSKHSRMPIDTADVISKSSLTEDENDPPVVNGDLTNCEATSGLATPIPTTPSVSDNLQNSVMSADNSCDFSQNNGQDFVSSPVPEYHTNSDNVSEEYRPTSEAKKKKKKKKSKKSKTSKEGEEGAKPSKSKPKKRADKETILCRNVLRELQSHEAATWFLFPVDCKLVPGYRKIIKKPIDFHTIEGRLKRGRYKSREDFVAEVRLVFDNCQRFNEDDSNIGRAGHEIRNFFEKRWAEIMKDMFGETVPDIDHTSISPSIQTDDVNEEENKFETDQTESNPVPESTEKVVPLYQSCNDSSGSGGLVIDDS
ncbi:uncharacterized protein LOC120341956 isoform X1 [Styela clava]